MALLRAVVAVLALASAGVSAEVHHVAGGWGPDLNVTAWLLGRVFLVGDKLWFESSGSEQAVVEVGNAHDFDACNVANPLRMYTDDRRVSLDREGMRYFASADPEMCRSGLKLPVIVHPLEDDPFRPHPWPTPEHFQPPSEHESPPWVDPPAKPEPHPPEWPTPEHFQPPSEHESPPWVDPPIKPEPHPPEWPTPEHFPPPSEYEPPPWVDPPVKPEPHPPEWPAPEHFQPPSEYEPPPWVEPPFKPEPPPYVGPVYPPEHRPPPPPPPPPSPPPPSPPSAASYISGPSFMFLMGGLVLLF